MLAGCSEKQLAQQVQYLKVENALLRSKLPKRSALTAREKQRLIKYGRVLGTKIRSLTTIVSPRTLLRRISDEKPIRKAAGRKPGRPKTADSVEQIILRLARENGWGYTRILGKLEKLGVTVSRSTVVNVLEQAGLDPGPKRGEGTWNDSVTRHAKTLWACDFFTKKVITAKGFVDVFVLFFIPYDSRKVYVSGMTANPDAGWIEQQARNTAMMFQDWPDRPTHLIRDLDTKFTKGFDAIFKTEDVEVVKVGPRKPNLNAVAERWVQSIKQECPDHFLVFGQDPLRHLVSEYAPF